MNKSKVLCVGVGQCGNNIVSEMLKKDKRYAGIFINSNYADLEGLYGIDPNNNNVIIFNGLNGSGKDRKLAKSYLQNQLEIVADMIMNYPTRNIVDIYCSTDGGTGSGIVPSLIAMLKRITKKTINLRGVKPDYTKANLLSLENALDFWNDIFQEQTTKSGMKYRIEETGKQRFIARVRAFSNESINDYSNHEIPDFWNECHEKHLIDEIRNMKKDGKKDLYGLCSPTKENEKTFDYGIGVIIDENIDIYNEEELLKKGCRIWDVDPATYVVFKCYGDNGDCISEMWSRFFKEFLPQSEYEQTEDTDYEIYYEKGEPGLFCELWIPIKKISR